MSDLHCHPSDVRPASSFLLSDQLKNPPGFHPSQALIELIHKDQLKADILLLGGDVTDRINQQGMISGWAFTQEIAAALSVETVAATLGNHDVDSRATHSTDAFKIARNFSPNNFPTADEAERTCFWEQGFCHVLHPQVLLLLINSVSSHFTSKDAVRGAISEESLGRLKTFLDAAPHTPFRVALVHHHPMAHEGLRLARISHQKPEVRP